MIRNFKAQVGCAPRSYLQRQMQLLKSFVWTQAGALVISGP